jgi:thiol-disulfide isomerase/thioredoxin
MTIGRTIFPMLLVLVLTILYPLVPAFAQDSKSASPDEENVKTELAKADKLLADGKTKKATDLVRDLYESTGNLRAGYALSQLLQKQGTEQLKRNSKKPILALVEGAQLARKLLADKELPAAVRDEVRDGLLNEARSLAAQGNVSEALKSVKDLLGFGLDNLDELESDKGLSQLTKTEEFKTWIADVRKAIRERHLTQARKEVAAFKSFPFNFEQRDLADQPISLSALRGKIVIVDFWGTWCPPCRAEIPAFVALKEKYSADLEIVGLAYEREDDPTEAAKLVTSFARKNKINYPCALGDEETKKMVPEFRGYPTTLFIDRNGKVRMVTVGAESLDRLDALVTALLEEE